MITLNTFHFLTINLNFDDGQFCVRTFWTNWIYCHSQFGVVPIAPLIRRLNKIKRKDVGALLPRLSRVWALALPCTRISNSR